MSRTLGHYDGMAWARKWIRSAYDCATLDSLDMHWGHGLSRMLKPRAFTNKKRQYEIDVWCAPVYSFPHRRSIIMPPLVHKDGTWTVAKRWKSIAITWPDDVLFAYFTLTQTPGCDEEAEDFATEHAKPDGTMFVTGRKYGSKHRVVSIGVCGKQNIENEAELIVCESALMIRRWLEDTKQVDCAGARDVRFDQFAVETLCKFRDEMGYTPSTQVESSDAPRFQNRRAPRHRATPVGVR